MGYNHSISRKITINILGIFLFFIIIYITGYASVYISSLKDSKNLELTVIEIAIGLIGILSIYVGRITLTLLSSRLEAEIKIDKENGLFITLYAKNNVCGNILSNGAIDCTVSIIINKKYKIEHGYIDSFCELAKIKIPQIGIGKSYKKTFLISAEKFAPMDFSNETEVFIRCSSSDELTGVKNSNFRKITDSEMIDLFSIRSDTSQEIKP